MRLSILLPFATVLGLASLSVAMPHKGSDVALQNKERGLDLSKNSLNEVFERGGGSYPSKTWQCDGTGKDGWDYDYNKNPCPYPGLGWKWFGSNHGWQPYYGWKCPSDKWVPPTPWYDQCSKATWFCPQSSWVAPPKFSIPPFWGGLGYHPSPAPSQCAPQGYKCNGKGTDGYSCDHNGNGLPAGWPASWKYFGDGGNAPGWQPCNTYQIPSTNWGPPSGWKPQGAPWFKPQKPWKVPKGYKCPAWWPENLLEGIFSWL